VSLGFPGSGWRLGDSSSREARVCHCDFTVSAIHKPPGWHGPGCEGGSGGGVLATMDWSSGQESGGLSRLLGRFMVAGMPTAVGIRGEASDKLTVVVAAWDTKLAGDVTDGMEGAEVGDKYLVFSTDINGDVEEVLVTSDEELVAAICAAWYLAARALSLACIFWVFLRLGLVGGWVIWSWV
jgi:hypothetical protein